MVSTFSCHYLHTRTCVDFGSVAKDLPRYLGAPNECVFVWSLAVGPLKKKKHLGVTEGQQGVSCFPHPCQSNLASLKMCQM